MTYVHQWLQDYYPYFVANLHIVPPFFHFSSWPYTNDTCLRRHSSPTTPSLQYAVMAPSPSSGLPPLQPGRKRRAHKRSRNGCSTCKQRHIRCDEVKPICTACLTRGGDCGYPEQSGAAGPSASTADASTGSALRCTVLSAESTNPRSSSPANSGSSSPANPFNSVPMMMPHRALERFNRFTTQNIFSPTSVPKSSDSECASLVLSNPGTFRASLLSTALSYSWLSGGLNNSDMEEALLSRKLEAMRVVNAQIADPVLRTSDGCLSLIAALALVESGMGNYAAAEAHLKGLFTLIDIKTPENWQHRLYGLLQRAIAVTGSFIAAAKRLDGVEVLHQVSEYELNNYEQQIYSMRIPSSSAASPVPATNLSPFYFGIGSPIITACKLDIEGLILINALRQLSSMPAIDHTGSHRSRGSSLNPGSHRSRSGTPLSTAENPIGSYELTTDGTAVLLADTDAYTVSLLFKPHPMHSGARNSQQTSRSMSPATSHSPFRSATTCEPSGTPPPSASYPPFSSSPRQQANIPSADPPVPVPSASRAWAAAAYLYLHIVLASVWEETEPTSPRTSTPTPNTPSTLQNYHQQLALQQHQQHLRQSSPNQDPSTSSAPRHTAAGPRIIGGVPVDPHLLRALLDTLRADLQHTEEGMRSGSYNRDFWLWKTAVGAYCVEVLGRGGLGTTTKASPPERVGGGEGAERRTWWGWVLEEDDEEEGGSDEVEDAEGGMVVDDDDEVELVGEGEEAYMARLGAWFGERLRAWGRAAQVSNWDAARRALDRIVWPAGQFAGEVVAEGVWWRAVGDGGTGGGMGRPVMVGEVVIDPLLR